MSDIWKCQAHYYFWGFLLVLPFSFLDLFLFVWKLLAEPGYETKICIPKIQYR